MRFIVDLDGTLLNSFDRHYILLKDILKAKGIYRFIEKDEFVKFKVSGKSTKKICKEYMGISMELVEEIAKDWVFHIEDTQYLALDSLYSDTEAFLEEIRKIGNVSILTARKNKQGVIRQISTLGLEKYIDEITIADPQNAMLEKREALVIARKKEEIVMIGDTETDCDAALQANVPFYVLNRGFRSKEYWDSRKIKSYNSLNEILREV